ncbi:acyl-CoA dehydrogenase [compost metagenome]
MLDETKPLQNALHQAIKAGKVKTTHGKSPVEAAIEAGLLQPAEGQRLQDAEQARRKVINVDAFEKDQLAPEPGRIR